MRILMLDNEFPPLGGGMGTVNLELFRQFALREDLEIDLVTASLGAQYQTEQFSKHIQIYKVPVWNRNIHHSSNRELCLYAAEAFWLARRLVRQRRYGFCFAWSVLPAGVVALALKRLFKLPFMTWVSGPDIPGFESRYHRLYPVLLPLIKSTWRASQPLIAKCQEEVDMIHAVDPEVPVQVIPNGADLEGFRSANLSIHEGPLKVISVARLIERKGQHHLIRAVKLLKDQGIDIQVSLVGTGDSLLNFQRLAQDLDVQDRVHFTGYVPREEINNHYQDAHVFVLPSFNEGMSLAALEAMAAGLPLIVTRTGGTKDILKEGVNGFSFDWGDISALAGHLEKLARDSCLVSRMGEASRIRAERFSWPVIAEEYIDLFSITMLDLANQS